MSKAIYDHDHRYKAINAKKLVYSCQVPGCPHSISAALLLNRRAACLECNTEMYVSAEHLRRTHITCQHCGGIKYAPNLPLSKQPTAPPETTVSANSLLEKMGLRK